MVVVTCSTLERSVGEKYMDRPHIRVPLQSGTWYVSDLILGRVLQEPTVFVALPVTNAEGDTSGLVLARLNLSWLSTFIANNDRFGDTSTILADSTGEYAAEFPPDDAPAAQILVHDVARVVLSRSEGATELQDTSGRRGVLVGFTRLSLNNAHLAVLLDKDAALASTNRALRESLIGFAAICALVGAASGVRRQPLYRARPSSASSSRWQPSGRAPLCRRARSPPASRSCSHWSGRLTRWPSAWLIANANCAMPMGTSKPWRGSIR